MVHSVRGDIPSLGLRVREVRCRFAHERDVEIEARVKGISKPAFEYLLQKLRQTRVRIPPLPPHAEPFQTHPPPFPVNAQDWSATRVARTKDLFFGGRRTTVDAEGVRDDVLVSNPPRPPNPHVYHISAASVDHREGEAGQAGHRSRRRVACLAGHGRGFPRGKIGTAYVW